MNTRFRQTFSRRPSGGLKRHTRPRQGSLMVELVVCTVLLSAVAASVMPGIRAVGEQRRATNLEALTLIELNNLAARLTQTSDSESEVFTPAFAKRYPETRVSIEPIESQTTSSLVRITITHPEKSPHPPLTRSLVIWRQPQEAPQ